MQVFADELYRSLRSRLSDLEELVRNLSGQLSTSRAGLKKALELVSWYPATIRAAAENDWQRNQDSVDRVELLRLYLGHVTEQAGLVEDWFLHGADEGVSASLLAAAERECDELLTAKRDVVLALGPVDNFETFISDLQDLLFGSLGLQPEQLPAHLGSAKFAMVRVPRIEGNSALWWPLVLGHELAHLAFLERDSLNLFDLGNRLDPVRANGLTVPNVIPHLAPVPAFAILQIGERWVEELICDAYAIRRFGPAAVAALGSFLELVGATELAGSHPPGWFRVRMAVRWLGSVSSPRLNQIIEPWVELATSSEPQFPDWASYLMELLEDGADDLKNLVSDWPASYDASSRSSAVEWVADQLKAGVAPGEFGESSPGRTTPLDDPDVINAGWLARVEETDKPLDRLVLKALESVDFVRRWHQQSGPEVEPAASESATAGTTGAALSGEAIATRLAVGSPNQLIITPRLPATIKGAGIDVRLGKHFIVFLRSAVALFDPLGVNDDPRAMQSHVEKGWGEQFILHPDELVLASTLEYLVIPADLSCQVITRSSYGRLGLITATAVLVHPHFRGCLTLELVNLGEVPIALTPGQRIAQLAFQQVDPPAPEPTTKYDCPTGPEFSRVRDDEDAQILRNMRRPRP